MNSRGRRIYGFFLTTIFVIFSMIGTSSFAENKHPRVSELEDQLRLAATDFFKARFPQIPFLMTVNVIPMRRSTHSGNDGDILPYMDFSGEEIQDEWDDPATTWQTLIQRSNRITVEISLSDAVADSDAGEAKETLFRTLHLTPGRDEIRVSLRKWVQTSTTTSKFDPVVIGSALIIVLSLLLGLYFIQWRSDKKPKQFVDAGVAAGSKKSARESPAPAFSMAPPPMSPAAKRTDTAVSVAGGSHSSGFNAFQSQSWVHETIRRITSSSSFPALEHLTELEAFGEKNSRGLGAILQEFPENERKLLFSLGSSNAWMLAMSEPGELGVDEANLIKKLSRIDTHRPRKKEDLLIALWRLKEEMPAFVRGLPKDLVLRALRLLPAQLTVQVAREAFPGAWADVLDFGADKNVGFEISDDADIDTMIERAYQQKPRLELHSAVVAKKQRELMDYLKFASPSEEREIYLAAGSRLPLLGSRPAFFRVIESTVDDLSKWAGTVPIDLWAKSLCNLSRNEMNTVLRSVSEKQSALLKEMVRRYEQEHLETVEIGNAREEVARIGHHYQKQLDAMPRESLPNSDSSESDPQAELGSESTNAA